MQELAWTKKKPTILLEDPPPAQGAQVDFGLMGVLVGPDTGKRRKLWALIVTLSFSRLMFVWPAFEQTTEAVCEGLDRAWRFFGGRRHTVETIGKHAASTRQPAGAAPRSARSGAASGRYRSRARALILATTTPSGVTSSFRASRTMRTTGTSRARPTCTRFRSLQTLRRARIP